MFGMIGSVWLSLSEAGLVQVKDAVLKIRML